MAYILKYTLERALIKEGKMYTVIKNKVLIPFQDGGLSQDV